MELDSSFPAFSVFSRTATRVALFKQFCTVCAFYWSIHIRPQILYSVWLKSYFFKSMKFGFFVGADLFAIDKHQSVYVYMLYVWMHNLALSALIQVTYFSPTIPRRFFCHGLFLLYFVFECVCRLHLFCFG